MNASNLIPAIAQPEVWRMRKEWCALESGTNEYGMQAMICEAASQLRSRDPTLNILDSLTQAAMRATTLREAAQGIGIFQNSKAALRESRGTQAKPRRSQTGCLD